MDFNQIVEHSKFFIADWAKKISKTSVGQTVTSILFVGILVYIMQLLGDKIFVNALSGVLGTLGVVLSVIYVKNYLKNL